MEVFAKVFAVMQGYLFCMRMRRQKPHKSTLQPEQNLGPPEGQLIGFLRKSGSEAIWLLVTEPWWHDDNVKEDLHEVLRAAGRTSFAVRSLECV